MEILTNSLIISLFCVGLRVSSSQGMILYFLRKPYEIAMESSFKYQYYLKPLIGCVVCMSSVYSLLISHLFLSGVDISIILTMFVVSALNALIYNLITK